jgi:hypothetical protein
MRCLENGLRALGGVPLLLNLDNLKVPVFKADWFDPEISPNWPTSAGITGSASSRPHKPQHKSKMVKWRDGSHVRGSEGTAVQVTQRRKPLSSKQWETQLLTNVSMDHA